VSRKPLLFFALILTAGCARESTLTGPDQGPSPSDGSDDPSLALSPSKEAILRFKGGKLFATTLSKGLEIPRPELCLELGRYDCVDAVHNITLGGVEPYRIGVNEPLSATAVTTPLAVERVAFAACEKRVRRDFDAPDQAKIFGSLVELEGPLDGPASERVDRMTTLLYRRLLLRNPEPGELADFRTFYEDVRKAGSPELRRDFAILSCVAIATTMESLFY
jgi:hypothetical protein